MSNKRRLEDKWRPEKRVCRESGWIVEKETQPQPYHDPFSIDMAPASFGSAAPVSSFHFWESSDNISRYKRKRSVEEENNSKRPKARNATPEPHYELFSNPNARKRPREDDEMELEDVNLKRRKMEIEDNSIESENEPIDDSRKRKFGFDPVIRKRIRANEFTSIRCLENTNVDASLFDWRPVQHNFIR